jgi:7-carboxy-7-deazaguanine synthase
MSKIKVSEAFYALQGEGRHVGVPSVFLRTFGCNLRCKKFGMDKSTEVDGPNPEVAEIIKNISVYKKLEELPLVSTGCDSYAAVYPEFKHLSPSMTSEDLAVRLAELTPKKQFDKNVHLVITGGEPFLWQKQLPDLIRALFERTFASRSTLHITFETNGTQMVEKEVLAFFAANCKLHFSVSPKLSCSGEKKVDAINEDVILRYLTYGDVDLKFVVASKEDVEEVDSLVSKDLLYVVNSHSFGHVYLMPVGGLNDMYQLNKTQVADLVLEKGYRFSPRLQCEISENSWGT